MFMCPIQFKLALELRIIRTYSTNAATVVDCFLHRTVRRTISDYGT